MQPAIDPFHPLLRVIDRYKRDVHELNAPATHAGIEDVGGHLGHPVPRSLASFLERWNGATLFRGALRVRSVQQLAPAATHAPEVIIFADGPTDADHWAYAHDGHGGTIFGQWQGEQGFRPLHERFDRWLAATVRILDEGVRRGPGWLRVRLEGDPDSAYLLVELAELELERGARDEALSLLRRATVADPDFVPTWIRLGDVLSEDDRQAGRWAWLKAFRALRLPAAHPTTIQPDASLVHNLAATFPPGDDGWERELTWFLEQAVKDVRDYNELALVEAAAVGLAQVHLDRGERTQARQTLTAYLDRQRSFLHSGPSPEATLMVASLEADLGHHDDAERHLRSLRHMPPPLAARAQLILGRITVMRQEPWAEEILHEAAEGLRGRPRDECEAALLLAERALLQGVPDQTEAALGRALTLARESDDDHLMARIELLAGDLNRERGALAEAEAAYARARTYASDHDELLQRTLVRRGDLYRIAGQADQAIEDYQRAAAAYDRLELPLRGAWVQLRLARLGVEGAVGRARQAFQAADLAAGVAAADAVAGQPEAHLGWHLERAAEHARERANAQRARPPMTRADAERPERRLGAHRMAIAACSDGVVRALSAWMDECARSLDTATPRLTDPNLSRYAAAADLLGAHRSFEAAEVLLHHLAEVQPAGLAGRGLIGAMARSPNIALVDGLLDAIEPGSDPAGRAAAAEVLGWRRELAAVQPLLQLCEPAQALSTRRAAVIALGRIGDRQAIEPLLPLLDQPQLAAEAGTTLLLLGEWQGLDQQAQALADPDTKAGAAQGEIVGRYGGPAYLLLLFNTAEREDAAGIGALHGLGYLGDPRAITRLIDVTGGRDADRRQVASGSLELITGHHEDPEESLLRGRWLAWWEAHSDRFQPGHRYRHGRAMDPSLLIERLGHDSALVRRSTYDELVISTGEHLPFDAEGPYRVQITHQAAWRRWWREQAGRFTAGRWSFHGHEIG